nr:MAG TPA: hypothetical protein [Caudoviricetes sp.]
MPCVSPPLKLNILNYPYDNISFFHCQYRSSIYLTF